MAPSYKLTYFEGQGRAEVIRLIFAQAGVEYEDIRISLEEWPQYKAKTPNGVLPTLEFNGKTYFQSHAISRYLSKKFGLYAKNPEDELRLDMLVDTIDDILRPIVDLFDEKERDPAKFDAGKKKYEEEQMPASLQNLEKLLIENKGGNGFFVGAELTWADIMFLQWAKWPTLDYYKAKVDLSKTPKLDALYNKLEKLPRLAAWIKKRPADIF